MDTQKPKPNRFVRPLLTGARIVSVVVALVVLAAWLVQNGADGRVVALLYVWLGTVMMAAYMGYIKGFNVGFRKCLTEWQEHRESLQRFDRRAS